MITILNPRNIFWIAFPALLLTACFVEDPGPRQETERQYTMVDFDRLEMGSGFHIDVEHGDFFSVSVRGDRRNIEDLIVEKQGSTLIIRYHNFRERRHDTFINITMPELRAVNFSGGSESHVYDFTEAEEMDVHLSGGSVCQLETDATTVSTTISGGSYLSLRGTGQQLHADVSGASALKAFHFPVPKADIELSGASDAEITVSNELNIVATGASHLVFRGNPAVTSEVSDSSSAHRE